MQQARRYEFDGVFRIDDCGLQEAAPVKKRFTAEEAEALRAQAYEDGRTSAEAAAAERGAAALEAIAGAAAETAGALRAERETVARFAASLALSASCALSRTINAGARRDEIVQVIDECLAALPDEPRIEVRAPVDIADLASAEIEAARARFAGLGDVRIVPDPALSGVDCRIVWGSGALSRAQADVEAEIAALVERHLTAASHTEGQFDLFADAGQEETQ